MNQNKDGDDCPQAKTDPKPDYKPTPIPEFLPHPLDTSNPDYPYLDFSYYPYCVIDRRYDVIGE
jgi:hypothetical protein